ncbi:NmrA family NAD(P)-binding protein [Ponticoccus sp. SC2-23]|uniref:NmrA family NAD(P)-binding protein n=1 Tax=Alexandriicola marinus TaxID=2081710 RepID=UPI00193B2617|nr:NmrA family NAD(P)-binding protein [Alexandriicola marinus]MBM1219510.1 NmrA family NAD(P)-binding protein [Ponticoccus sp. SC6-9]MBM1223418.1 NmrA family NAD(P)-binding protein [Ponticoccus sp. SC6-15]MBM1232384.1 NmrA family NAD(P)-binding protein [Ponticoccus sp. SC6-45]MBM1237666.1 NmrA family NAD(P)-binding protein [Ponticoccus sp. SC6-49]MBM1241395.1 NmrA family NAD(P)-binding protein [Ponticoccus sp. SC2-64]MBM1245908.1 NmrA family NAD(P)-binding protein [Ponticoccus sp. SC6-42]MBM
MSSSSDLRRTGEPDAAGPMLVTGSSGNTGREVMRAAAQSGFPVRATHRPGSASVEGSVPFDFAEPETWDKALEGASSLFLMRPPPIADMKTTLIPFIAAARQAGIGRIVFLSVTGADTARWVPHHAVEAALVSGPTDWTILRAGFFAQNLQDAYRKDIRERDRLHVPAGRGKVAFIDLRDLAEVAVLAAQGRIPAGQAHELTGPGAITFHEVAAELSRALGRRISYRPAAILPYLFHLRREGRPWMASIIQTYLHVGLRFGQAETVSRAIPDLLGREATPIRDYIARNTAIWQRG